tara:strand:+ start:3249 stop:3935 length:687 start_codon:yes stop_codon:yes gene_type:complete
MSRISSNSFLVDAEQRIQMSLSNISPDISGLTVAQSNPDLLNCNANVQQGDADVSTSNPLFVQFNTGGEEIDLVKVGNSAIALGQTVMASALPVVIASDQSRVNCDSNLQVGDADVSSSNRVPTDSRHEVQGSQANLSNAQSVVASDVSTSVNVEEGKCYTIFGLSSDSVNYVDIEISVDNSNWYPTGMGIYPDGTGNLFTTLQNTPVKYIRLKYNGTATVTASVSWA